MALAGWSTEQMIEGLPAVLNLAASAQMDLAEASDIVTDNVTAFGLAVEDSAHLADVMAYAMSHSNTDVTQLGEAYKNVAATAASLGYSVEDTTAVLMTMANAGVKGGEAGTALNAVMARIATNTNDAAGMLQSFGIKVYDTNGNMVELSEILEGLSDVWETLTGEEQANLAKIIAGQNHYSAFNTIMQGVSENAKKGGNSFQDYTKALKTCDGAAKEMSATMNDNLEGDLKTLNSVWEDFQLTLYKTESGAMRQIVQTISGSLIPALEALVTGADNAKELIADAFSDILDTVGEIGGNLVGSFFGEEAGAAIQDLFGTLSDAMQDIFGLFDEVGPILSEVITQISTAIQQILPPIIDIIHTILPLVSKIVETLGKAANTILPVLQMALEAINAILGPIVEALEPLLDILGAIFDVIGWVVDGLKWFFSGCPVVAEGFEEVTEAARDLNRELDSSVRSWNSMIDSQEKAYSKSSNEIQGIEDMVAELDKLVDRNGKVKKGYEDRATYLTTKIAEATGVEIECNKGVVKSYDDIREAIEEVINVKKANALIDYYQAIVDQFQGGANDIMHKINEATALLDKLKEEQEGTTAGTDEWNQLAEDIEKTSQNISNLRNQFKLATESENNLQKATSALYEKDWKTINQMKDDKIAIYTEDGQMYAETSAQKIENLELEVEMTKELYKEAKEAGNEELAAYYKNHKSTLESQLSETKKEATQEASATASKFNKMADSATGFNRTVLWALGNAGSGGGSNFVNSLNSWGFKSKEAGENLKSNAEDGASGSYDGGKKEGSNFGSGFWHGVDSWVVDIKNKAADVVKAAMEAARKAQESHSPSKKTRQLGQYFGEGYALGIEDKMKDAVEAAKMGVNATLTTVSHETVTMIPSLSAMAMFDNIGARDSNLLFAINGLRSDIRHANLGVNNYLIDGITYDDGSNVSGAVRDLIHAAKIERRV